MEDSLQTCGRFGSLGWCGHSITPSKAASEPSNIEVRQEPVQTGLHGSVSILIFRALQRAFELLLL